MPRSLCASSYPCLGFMPVAIVAIIAASVLCVRRAVLCMLCSACCVLQACCAFRAVQHAVLCSFMLCLLPSALLLANFIC